ncbi:MAG: GIY-YIG nuclease family protein [bacterium]|nr:GIY-YIG nuclease family protein [bacterium]
MTLSEFKPRRPQGVGVPTEASGKKVNFNRIPDMPGVYFFLDKRKKVLYIGKATSLRSRVRSYFASDIGNARGPLITAMIEKAQSVDWRETDSVLEALILEANLIRTHKPPHNIELKDDKSFNYVIITKEDFPRILVVRGKELESRNKSKFSGTQKSFAKDFLTTAPSRLRTSPQTSFVVAYTFGPFPHSGQLKEAMRIIRKIFPYRDTCTSCQNTKDCPLYNKGQSFVRCKPCFNRHIGLCPGVCSGEISKTEYRKIVRRIVLFFRGKKKELLKNLERGMRSAAKQEKFEEAATLLKQVFALQHIQDVSLIKDEYRSTSTALGATREARVEAYDVAHLGGSAAVGVMVVVANGEAQKNDYRVFTIRNAKAGDDVGALREILSRRLWHEEWPLPRLVVVDGSVGQVNAARKVLSEYAIQIPVVGVVKDEKHRPRSIVGNTNVGEKDILLANAEAHRFAISRHRRALRARLTR